MIFIDREKVRKTFADYTANYNAQDEKLKLKINHTYRVAGLCDRIADSIGLVGEDRDIAWLLGMLHDVGRFEQIRRYHTFNDANSIDHAKLGADLLFNDGLMEEYVPGLLEQPERDLVELAIRQHNTYRLPETLTEREATFCKLIRDADKIDIFKVNIDTPMEEIYDVTTEEIKNGQITDEVLAAFDEEHCILKSIRKSAVDNLVGHISLAYELEFPISLKLAVDQGYIMQMMNFKSDNEKTNQQMEHIRDHMKKYIERNIVYR